MKLFKPENHLIATTRVARNMFVTQDLVRHANKRV